MSRERLLEVSQGILNTAKEKLSKGGVVPPTLFMFQFDGTVGINELENTEELPIRRYLPGLLNIFGPDIEFYVLVNEAWIVVRDSNKDAKELERIKQLERTGAGYKDIIGVNPVDSPERREALYIIAMSRDDRVCIQIELNRKNGKLSFGEQEEMRDPSGGLFVPLPPRNPLWRK